MTQTHTAENDALVCRLCGQEVRWARGLRWTPSQRSFLDVRHLIRADNGLHSGRCPASTDVDQMHVIPPEEG